jgi:ubiquinone/menaquinone biosynthesis C-methylase UbiE
MLSKMEIRLIEEKLPAISASLAKMQQIDRLSINTIYKNAEKVFMNIERRAYILEIGCGDGLWLNHMHNDINLNCETYVGIDFSINKLKLAKKASKELKLNEKVAFILADAEFLPFKKDVFDVAILLEVLEHFLKPDININALAETISPSGKVLITTPSAYGANMSISSILGLIFWPSRQNVKKVRNSSITVQGLVLPHLDFTLIEIIRLISPNFLLKKHYSFNFGLQFILIKFLPKNSTIKITKYIERKASWFPYTWGHSWMLLLEKKSTKETKNEQKN